MPNVSVTTFWTATWVADHVGMLRNGSAAAAAGRAARHAAENTTSAA